ncbi:hypothetical protein [Paracoccus zhejiangensis]|uniref:Sialate O-acetylesterase domain-containing protein n=1 Tax=Paracoccus zhejiangensis TaxID=1077935 RepID=A0A2H5F1D5_9RHOB|nr:hypothetical protein [Paracoccus zhejiangensis]AUH65365.1 hypothetical protein CX676_15315 [Paracoccus zhejiangensis]
MTDHSVLLLAYGQSNADLYPAAPALPCEAFGDPRIVTFNDGHAFRGLLGASPLQEATALVPAGAASYETVKCRNYQSFQIAAAARLLHETGIGAPRHVIVRAEGRGGRRFHGTVAKNGLHVEGILSNVDGTDSQILLNLSSAIRISATLALQAGAPLSRIIVNFVHGEADRGTPKEIYRQNLERLIDRVAGFAAEFDLPVHWLILDPAGTSSMGSGNNWHCRLAMREVASSRSNAHLIGAGYAYPLDDLIHYTSEARVLFGEHFGTAAAHLLARDAGAKGDLGWMLDAPGPPQAFLRDSTVELHLPGSTDFELIAGISDAELTVEGFSASHAARCRVIGVVQSGPRSVRVQLDQPPSMSACASLDYAFQIVRRDDRRSDSPLPAGRGGWRSVRALDSMVLPGRRIHQWVPGFSIPFAEMEQG